MFILLAILVSVEVGVDASVVVVADVPSAAVFGCFALVGGAAFVLAIEGLADVSGVAVCVAVQALS